MPLIAVSFGLMFYDVRAVFVPSSAKEAYAELIGVGKGLDGPVYSPSLGQLPDSFRFCPAALWVALDDISRCSNAGEVFEPGAAGAYSLRPRCQHQEKPISC